MEVQKAPQNIESAVVKVKPGHFAAPGQSRRLVPRQPSADGTKGEYQRPNSAKSSVWRFPFGVFELVVPRAQVGQGIANTGNPKTDSKAQGQTAPLPSRMWQCHVGCGGVVNVVCHCISLFKDKKSKSRVFPNVRPPKTTIMSTLIDTKPVNPI